MSLVERKSTRLVVYVGSRMSLVERKSTACCLCWLARARAGRPPSDLGTIKFSDVAHCLTTY